jgi:hypothetical protein
MLERPSWKRNNTTELFGVSSLRLSDKVNMASTRHSVRFILNIKLPVDILNLYSALDGQQCSAFHCDHFIYREAEDLACRKAKCRLQPVWTCAEDKTHAPVENLILVIK